MKSSRPHPGPRHRLLAAAAGVALLSAAAAAVAFPASVARAPAAAAPSGTNLGEASPADARLLYAQVPMLVARLRMSGQPVPAEVGPLLAAADEAYLGNEYSRAYRLYARAAGLARGEEDAEASEVAASLRPALNREVFAAGETVVLTVRPLFDPGHPLAGRYFAAAWLETGRDGIIGATQLRMVNSLGELRFEFPAGALPDGTCSVGYRLTSPSGETLAELRQAVVVSKDADTRIRRLDAKWSALRPLAAAGGPPVLSAALSTIQCTLESLRRGRE